MKNKIKTGLISFVVICLLIIGFFWYSYKTVPRDLLFDMDKILGESTNKPYEIRNDVYDFIINNEVPKYKLNKEQTMLLLNIAKNNQMEIKYFDDEDMSIKLYRHWRVLFKCSVNDKNLKKWIDDNYTSGSLKPRPYDETLYNNSDIILVRQMAEQHIINADYNKTKLNLTDSQKEEFCRKHSQRIFNFQDLNL